MVILSTPPPIQAQRCVRIFPPLAVFRRIIKEHQVFAPYIRRHIVSIMDQRLLTILLFHIILLGNLDDVAHFEIALIHFGNFKRGNRCAVENNPGFALQIFSCIILKFTLHDVLGMVFQLFQGTRIEECVCIDTPRLHFLAACGKNDRCQNKHCQG